VGGERVGPDAELAFALLLVLTLSEGRPLGRRQLIDLLWPATTEARARHNLRQALYKLRQLGVPV
jgi:DNA-binding SARP family transcriptional activator